MTIVNYDTPSCIHVLSVKALPEPPLEVVWIARYFFASP